MCMSCWGSSPSTTYLPETRDNESFKRVQKYRNDVTSPSVVTVDWRADKAAGGVHHRDLHRAVGCRQDRQVSKQRRPQIRMRAVQLSIWAGNARRRPLDPVVRDIPARARVSLSESWFVRQELPASVAQIVRTSGSTSPLQRLAAQPRTKNEQGLQIALTGLALACVAGLPHTGEYSPTLRPARDG